MTRQISLILSLLISSQAFGATKLFTRNTASAQAASMVAVGYKGYGCNQVTGARNYKLASTVAGAAAVNETQTPSSTAPPCDTTDGTNYFVWLSPPLSAGLTLSGNVDFEITCNESNVNLNGGARMIVYRWYRGGFASVIITSAARTECGGTRVAITAAAPTSTAMLVNDRIAIVTEITNTGGTWGGNNSRTWTNTIEAASASNGDNFVNFADTISFAADTWIPTGFGFSSENLLHWVMERFFA